MRLRGELHAQQMLLQKADDHRSFAALGTKENAGPNARGGWINDDDDEWRGIAWRHTLRGKG